MRSNNCFWNFSSILFLFARATFRYYVLRHGFFCNISIDLSWLNRERKIAQDSIGCFVFMIKTIFFIERRFQISSDNNAFIRNFWRRFFMKCSMLQFQDFEDDNFYEVLESARNPTRLVQRVSNGRVSKTI